MFTEQTNAPQNATGARMQTSINVIQGKEERNAQIKENQIMDM